MHLSKVFFLLLNLLTLYSSSQADLPIYQFWFKPADEQVYFLLMLWARPVTALISFTGT